MSVAPSAARLMQRQHLPAEPGDDFVLMSDGLAALIDSYQLPIKDFVARLAHSGLAALANDLWALEAADDCGARCPRFKRCDDATALWVRLAPEETN